MQIYKFEYFLFINYAKCKQNFESTFFYISIMKYYDYVIKKLVEGNTMSHIIYTLKLLVDFYSLIIFLNLFF